MTKINFKQNLKRTPKSIFAYSTLAIILAFVSLLALNYCQFYVHEFGHSSAAVLSTMTRHDTSISINFTYIDFKIPLTDLKFKVPQQTISRWPVILSVYGVLFTIIFYTLIFLSIAYFLSKIKNLKENNRITFALMGVLALLIINDIISNLFCGTDGLNLHCSNNFLIASTGIFLFAQLLFLGYFYMELFLIKFNIFNKNNKRRLENEKNE
jgi:hypothetical protein